MHQAYEGPWSHLVHVSALVLRGAELCPTARSSPRRPRRCPEEIGGVRNWDYRYTWVRDASFTMAALGGGLSRGRRLLRFLRHPPAGAGDRPGLQIMYGIRGENVLPEHELPHLPATATAARCASATVPGASIRSTCTASCSMPRTYSRLNRDDSDDDTRSVPRRCRRPAVLRWMDIDEGIWEVRGGAGHFLYSKVMNWVALDRAVKLATGADHRRIDAWTGPP